MKLAGLEQDQLVQPLAQPKPAIQQQSEDPTSPFAGGDYALPLSYEADEEEEMGNDAQANNYLYSNNNSARSSADSCYEGGSREKPETGEKSPRKKKDRVPPKAAGTVKNLQGVNFLASNDLSAAKQRHLQRKSINDKIDTDLKKEPKRPEISSDSNNLASNEESRVSSKHPSKKPSEQLDLLPPQQKPSGFNQSQKSINQKISDFDSMPPSSNQVNRGDVIDNFKDNVDIVKQDDDDSGVDSSDVEEPQTAGGSQFNPKGFSVSDIDIKKTIDFNPNDRQFIIPPPEALIQKSAITAEPAKTGAPIAFVKLQRLLGRERIERMGPDKVKGQHTQDRLLNDVNAQGQISDYIINSYKQGTLVYCRFGEKYVTDLEKRKNSVLSQCNQPHTNLASASYLINVKKLIEEHNIDGEKRDFKQMKTKSLGKDQGSAPQQFYKPKGPDDKTLLFESRFESGNLLAAVKITDNEYDLVLQNDINTNGHTQWFFFRTSNTIKGMKIKFNIVNLAKPDSLYNYGMKILNFSNRIKHDEGIGWHRVGEGIDYFQNNFKRDGNPRFQRTFYTLTFSHTFSHSDDQQFFAHCFPYTYSDLQDDLTRIEKDTSTQNYYHRGTLTRTLAGNRCEYLTVTNKDKDPKSAKAMAKKGIFISARVHPGESNASWMMKGVIDFLISSAPEAKALRDHFVFKIVPILNPDGVINGNYRCSLSGQDLNRRWKNPSKILHPVIFSVKKLMRAFAKERECVLYCDLHGHSRRKNIFMYGNNLKETPHATRVFPYIMSKLCDFFSFEQSRFSMSKYKEATARIAMFKELGIPNIFTMEASFCGADRGKFKDQHFTTEYLMLAGRRLLETLIVYCKIDVHQSIKHIKKSEDEEEAEYTKINAKDLERELTTNKKLITMTNGRDDGESSGSDSEPSADNLEEEEMAQVVPIKPKPQVQKPPPPKKKALPVPKKKEPSSPPAGARRSVVKEITRSPMKKSGAYNPFERISLRQKRKPEMKDAWTQTTPRAKDENRRRKEGHHHSQSKSHATQEQLLRHQQRQNLQNLSASQNGQFPTGSQQQFQSPQQYYLQQQQLMAMQQSQQRHHQNNSLIQKQQQQLNQKQQLYNKLPGTGQDSHSSQPLTAARPEPHPSEGKIQAEGGNSPQPQIRVRKENFKQRPSNGLAKFEESLLNDKDGKPEMQQQPQQLNQLVVPNRMQYGHPPPGGQLNALAMTQNIVQNMPHDIQGIPSNMTQNFRKGMVDPQKNWKNQLMSGKNLTSQGYYSSSSKEHPMGRQSSKKLPNIANNNNQASPQIGKYQTVESMSLVRSYNYQSPQEGQPEQQNPLPQMGGGQFFGHKRSPNQNRSYADPQNNMQIRQQLQKGDMQQSPFKIQMEPTKTFYANMQGLQQPKRQLPMGQPLGQSMNHPMGQPRTQPISQSQAMSMRVGGQSGQGLPGDHPSHLSTPIVAKQHPKARPN